MTGAILPQSAACEIRFGDKYPDHNYCLLEVDEAILEEIKNDRIVIKGSADDEAVLCTDSKTFSLKNLEISNSVLLVDSEDDLGSSNAEVVANISATMEIAQIQPKFDRLRLVLKNNALNDDNQSLASAYDSNSAAAESVCNFDEDKSFPFLSWNWLLRNIQASPKELEDQLRRLNAQEIKGQYRVIDRPYLLAFLESFLLLVVEKDWMLANVPIDELHNSLSNSEYPSDVTDACMRTFADREGGGFWKVDMEKLARLKAERLFEDDPKWPLEAFLQKWQEGIPTPSCLSLSTLSGLALHDGRFIWYFPVDNLSPHPASRFKTLFLERERWRREDILPYLETLQIPGETTESLILKHCRTIQENAGEPIFYSSRWRIAS